MQVSIAPEQIMMQMIHGKCISRCVSVVADLGIADLLANGPKDSLVLAAATGTNADALHRVLRLLAAVGVFTELPNGCFLNNALSEKLITDSEGSVRHYARWFGRGFHCLIWSGLDYSVRTGKPWSSKDHPDKSPFEVLSEYPADQQVFNDAMAALSAAHGPAIVNAYDFAPFERIVDVGGGHGTLAMLIAEQAARASVAVFDLPHVIQDGNEGLSGTGAPMRIEYLAGSFFESLPGPTDLFVLKHVLHDWDDNSARRILTNCRHALRSGGRVLICEMVIEPGPKGITALLLDIEMLAGAGGRERTKSDFSRLLTESGLELRRVIPTDSPISLLEAAVS
jgi:SAM-dependent methyltransferase